VDTCPQCFQSAAKHLDVLSRDAWVWYFKCSACRFVWTVPKDGHGEAKHA